MAKVIGEGAIYQTSVAPVAPEAKKGAFESALNVFKKLEKEGANKGIPTRAHPQARRQIAAQKTEKEGANKVIPTRVYPQATQQIAAQKTEKEEIENRSGHLWECIGRKPDKFGGYLYQFKLKKEFDDVTSDKDLQAHLQAIDEKNDQIFPAVEFSGIDVLYLDPKVDIEKNVDRILEKRHHDFIKNMLKSTPESKRRGLSEAEYENYLRNFYEDDDEEDVALNREREIKSCKKLSEVRLLGYEMQSGQDGVYLNLPDREALLSRWKKLQETRPELPDLDIVSSEGVAGDLEYVEAYLKHHALLSSGIEFVHDSLVHLIPVLADILASGKNGTPSYKYQRGSVVKSITKIYQKILKAKSEFGKGEAFPESQRSLLTMQFKEIEMALGALVDFISVRSFAEARMFVYSSRKLVKNIWEAPIWKPYLDKRFGAGNINSEELSKLWDKIQEIEL